MRVIALILLLSMTALASDEIQPVASETRRLRIENAMLKVQNFNLQSQAVQKSLQEAQKDLNEQILAAAGEQKLNIDDYDFDFRSLTFRRKADQGQ